MISTRCICLLRGRVEYIVENHIYRMRPGDWMLTSPLELHQARIVTDADAYERFVLMDRPALPGTPLHAADKPDPLL